MNDNSNLGPDTLYVRQNGLVKEATKEDIVVAKSYCEFRNKGSMSFPIAIRLSHDLDLLRFDSHGHGV